MKKEGPDGANERHVCLATPLSFPVSNYYIVNGAMKPRQSRFAETVARGTRVHASIRPASGGITFSADKPVSRTHTHTHTQLPRLLAYTGPERLFVITLVTPIYRVIRFVRRRCSSTTDFEWKEREKEKEKARRVNRLVRPKYIGYNSMERYTHCGGKLN